MLTNELLSLICCPSCRADLSYDAEKNRLTCTACGAVYEVKDGIPILLPAPDGR